MSDNEDDVVQSEGEEEEEVSEEEEEEEDTNSEEEESEQEEEVETNVEEPQSPTSREEPVASGPSEAELALQRRRKQLQTAGIDENTLDILDAARKERECLEEEIRQLHLKRRRRAKDQLSASGLDEDSKEMLAANQVERDQLADEIQQMRARSERRKKEREAEEKRLAEQRAAEDTRRKAEEEERKKKKEEEERQRRDMRAEKMAEFEKWKNPPKPNFVIERKKEKEDDEEKVAKRKARTQQKKGGTQSLVPDDEESGGPDKKSREQLEAEKKAILGQRIQPLNIDGADMSKLTEKAKELQNLILRLESEKYDLEKRFKCQQYDMMELAARARQMNKVGRGDQIKRLQDEDDKMAERFAGCPSKIVMYSEFERQKDKRDYGIRRDIYKGPVYGFAAERIQPSRIVKWDEGTGLPIYENLDGSKVVEAEEEGEE